MFLRPGGGPFLDEDETIVEDRVLLPKVELGSWADECCLKPKIGYQPNLLLLK
jgi:hypothetical protein